MSTDRTGDVELASHIWPPSSTSPTPGRTRRPATHHDTFSLHECDRAENRDLFHYDRTVYRYRLAQHSHRSARTESGGARESVPMSAYGVQAILDLAALGAAMYRQRLRREQPEIDESQLDVLVGEWLRSRHGAPQGDAVGRSAERFRQPV